MSAPNTERIAVPSEDPNSVSILQEFPELYQASQAASQQASTVASENHLNHPRAVDQNEIEHLGAINAFPQQFPQQQSNHLNSAMRSSYFDAIYEASNRNNIFSKFIRCCERAHYFLRRKYRYLYNKKCLTILILEFFLIILYVMSLLTGGALYRLSIGLFLASTFAIFLECAQAARERYELEQFIRNIQRQRRRELPSIVENNREEGLNRGTIEVNLHANELNHLPLPFIQELSDELESELSDLNFIEQFPLQSNLAHNQAGLSKSQINVILPLQKYQSCRKNRGNESDIEEEVGSSNNCCTICLDDFQQGQDIRISPCSHLFHPACIEAWVRLKSVCPNCKRELQVPPVLSGQVQI